MCYALAHIPDIGNILPLVRRWKDFDGFAHTCLCAHRLELHPAPVKPSHAQKVRHNVPVFAQQAGLAPLDEEHMRLVTREVVTQ